MRHKKKLIGCSVAVIIGLVVANYSDEIRTSQKGLELIGNAESCMKEPYKCPADVWTVGIGSTGNIKFNKIYSDEEIAKRWVDDIKSAEFCVNRWANGKELPQGAFDSLVSLTFNVGCGKLKYSTIYKYAKNKIIKAMCNEFPRWKYSSGRELKGLVIRREKEKTLCLSSIEQ